MSGTAVEKGKGRQQGLLAPFSSVGAVLALAAAIAGVLALSNLFPGIDLAASRFFFAEASCEPARSDPLALCGAFPAGSVPFLAQLRQLLQALPLVLAAALGIYLLVGLIRGARVLSPAILAGSAAFWTYVLSVGLFVNALLKTYSGRPRPRETSLFGGDLPFVPAGDFAGACVKNCSFVSGEAAAAFWLLCMVPLLPARWRMPGFAAALGIALVTAAMRVAFGAHYASDVLLAGLLTLLTFSVLALAAARLADAFGTAAPAEPASKAPDLSTGRIPDPAASD